MNPLARLQAVKPQALILLFAAAVFVGVALAGRSFLGLDPPMQAVLAAVFAAAASAYLG